MIKKTIIISLTSDIAGAIAREWVSKGMVIVGTYRNKSNIPRDLQELGVTFLHCDVSNAQACDSAAEKILQLMPDWDVILFATGTLNPIGPFVENNMDEWTDSLHTNLIGQLRLLHQLLNGRKIKQEVIPTVIFFAGGGANNAVTNYSAYTVSKIALTKMCELLDAEIPDVKFSIVGPGIVKTKIHDEMIKAGEKNAGNNYFKVLNALQSEKCTPFSDVILLIDWIISQPREVVSGRNFSVVYDDTDNKAFVDMLKNNVDMYKLRRFMNQSFVKL